MNYGLKKPCASCPFVKAHNFPLMPDRIMEIADASSFPCHNTVNYDYETSDWDDEEFEGVAPPDRDTSNEHQCLGWLVVQWAEYEGFPNATAFMAARGYFKPEELPSPEEAGCFATFGEYAEREEGR